MIEFIKNNWLNLLLVLVGASAIFVYALQKVNEKKAAATKVLLQVDQIEKTIATLKTIKEIDNVSIYKIPMILLHNSWEECGYQFYGSMGRDDIRLIDEFFSCAAELEKSRAAICHAIAVAWEHKDAELQAKIAELISEKRDIEAELAPFCSSFYNRSDVFTARLPLEILLTNLNGFKSLSGTTAYKRLQEISYRK